MSTATHAALAAEAAPASAVADAFRLTAAQQALLPTADEVAFYREHGWYISRQIIPEHVLAGAKAAAERYYRGDVDRPVRQIGWTPDKGDVLRKNDFSMLSMDGISALVRWPLIGAVAARLEGIPAIRLWHDQLLYKPVDPPTRSSTVGWHTDRQYWKTCTSDHLITGWVPFHDCDETLGTVQMWDGSHRWAGDVQGMNFFENNLALVEQQAAAEGKPVKKVAMNLKLGQASYHHCRTVHGSSANRGAHPRQSVASHLQGADNRWRELRRANGSLISHSLDELVRKDASGHPDYADPEVCPVLWSEPG